MRDDNFMNIGKTLPAVLSGDLVGIVVKNGTEIAPSFPIGSQIFSQMSAIHKGGLQEYAVVNGEYAALVPPGISATEAALYPVNAVTSAVALFTPIGLGIPFPGTPESTAFDYASEKLAVIGGGSNIGRLAIQYARIAGIGTIIAIAAPSNTEALKAAGATHVISRHDADIESQVREIVGDDLVHVLDTINGSDRSTAVSLLSNTKPGILVHLKTIKTQDTLLAKKKAPIEDKHIIGASGTVPEFGKLFWRVFPTWLESGKVQALPYKVIDGLDADKVNAALDAYRDGTAGMARWHVNLAA